MKKQWQILQPDINAVETVRNTLKCNPVTAAILVNRKIATEKDALNFHNPSISNLRPPFSMKDMDIAVSRIYTAITDNEKILVFGDYDVDGVTATTILYEFFLHTGADVSYYIPDRISEGYSLKPNHISDYVLPNRINLIITTDCGSGSHEAVKMAQDAGTDVIITDHHNISLKPPAIAIINPKREDCPSGFENLAGVGVAFYLLICLRKYLRDKGFWQDIAEPNLKNYCDLVALGTVADVVPLIDENRIFSKTGLGIINSGTRPGISALIEASRVNGSSVDTQDIAFRLAPRLNAAGRLDHAKTSVELLTTKDPETAKQIAQSLSRINTRRQNLEKKILEQILKYLKTCTQLHIQNTLVLSHHEWHEGVLGIVASKLVDLYYRPVVLIGTRNGIGKGSGRSIPGIDLHQGIMACADDLEHFGGHAMAAGLTIKKENIAKFQKNFENAVSQMAAPDSFSHIISIDYELNFDKITDRLTDELEFLQPFGEGNPEPLFMAGDVRVAHSKIVGKNHRQMILRQGSARAGRSVRAIRFNIDKDAPLKERFDQISFRLRWNRWNNRKTQQIIVEDA
ncbi:MAG: single-stranded-DNA-specific exonuclease RecJ [Desulfobacterales bacterium]|nr:single-stranded-DNA-specific exonuclease RecJ [Desulfobacterales bacterium]